MRQLKAQEIQAVSGASGGLITSVVGSAAQGLVYVTTGVLSLANNLLRFLFN